MTKKTIILILLSILFVSCNEGTRYDEPTFSNYTYAPITHTSRGEIKIEDVKWEFSQRYKSTNVYWWGHGGVKEYTLQPCYVSVVRIEKTKLEGDSTDFSKSDIWIYPSTWKKGRKNLTDFTYEETDSEIILNLECPSEIEQEPLPYIMVEYIYYTTDSTLIPLSSDARALH